MSVRDVQEAEELQRLSRAIEAVERRLEALEGMLAASAVGPRVADFLPSSLPVVEPGVSASGLLTGTDTLPSDADSSREVAPSLPSPGLASALALVGRTLVVLGGAYLLRALSDGGVLAPPVGIALGLLYAAVWLMAAERARTDSASIFHALAATLIAMPIVWEATFRFALLTPASGVLLLGLSAAATMVVATRRQLQAIAWLGAGGTAVMAVVLAVGTRSYVGHAVFLILLGIGTLWLGYLHQWVGLRWPIAWLATILVGGVAARGVAGQEPLAALLVAALFLTGYLGSFAARTLFLGRAVIPFEVAQSIVVLIVGFGGAVYVTSATGASVGALGLLALVLGATTYGVAFAFVERRRPPGNFFFYSSLALTFILVGAPLAAGSGAAAATFAGLAVMAAALAPRLSRLTLRLHCAAYAIAAATLSGLLGAASRALLSPAREAWPVISPVALLALFAVLLCALWPVSAAVPRTLPQRLPGFVLLGLGVWLVAGTSVALLVPALLPATGANLDAGAVAAIRTVVLVAVTLLLARGGRHAPLADGVWLVNPLLVWLALKLLVEDVPHGRPLTLMTALAVYGVALIVAPRLR